ncbi:MAG: hypothetical protein GAKPKEKM_01494 [Rhodocyclaceae bacterium]|nr:hypothetical protein [Rhodocyclaceae bacterium]
MGNYAQKLADMRSRRLGVDSVAVLSKSAEFAEATTFREAYETRSQSEATKYALGAMQALEPKYTQVSVQEGERVRNQLNTGLQNVGIPVTFEYQGSVPLDIHIRFASDIDLLVLHDEFVTLDWTGPRASFYSRRTGSILDDMLHLRKQCELILERQFPMVKVDKTGPKSISLSGGSLRRKVDVVPSHWHDTATFQATHAKHDREVKVLHRDERTLLTNRPFLHMKRIEDKDLVTHGGLKKVIRLLKNLKHDSGKDIKLTSYDIAALAWHLDDADLNKPYYLELSLIAEAQRYLQLLVNNPQLAVSLVVPDGSRNIIDLGEKFSALQLLKLEVDQLATDIARELTPQSYAGNYEAIRRSLMNAHVL